MIEFFIFNMIPASKFFKSWNYEFTKSYIKVFVALMVLLGLTVGAAMINMGPLNLFVAMTISVIKATLVLLIFMHVRDSDRMVWVLAQSML